MLRRIFALLAIVIALTSFIVSSSSAQDANMPRKKQDKKEHRSKKHTGVKKSHKMKKKVKEEKEDSRIKVN